MIASVLARLRAWASTWRRRALLVGLVVVVLWAFVGCYQTIKPLPHDLVFRGDPTRLLKACASCHGRDGRGGQFDHPALSGQYPEYFIYTLTEFQEDDRTNDIYSRMRHIAQALTEEEIEALASYYGTAVPEEEE